MGIQARIARTFIFPLMNTYICIQGSHVALSSPDWKKRTLKHFGLVPMSYRVIGDDDDMSVDDDHVTNLDSQTEGCDRPSSS
ncbi:hypothetical protein QQ045_000431 [Rhodiola kirilowii]